MAFYRRHLPHWIPDDTILFVTWRLAGSLPTPEPEVLTIENTGRTKFRVYDDRLDRVESGPVWLSDCRVARMVEDALRYGESVKGWYDLYAWVIMSNHVHVVLQPRVDVSNIMRWLKGRTARLANRILGRIGLPSWQDESYDHWIRSDKELAEAIDYVEDNPVKAGLVVSKEHWPWSSARRRQTTKNDGLSHSVPVM